MGLRGVVREPSRELRHCELTHLARSPIDVERALRQHRAMVETLRAAGVQVEVLPALEGYPDACFVEDAVVVLPEVVIRTRSGARSRRGEFATLEGALPDRPLLAPLREGQTLDGGDVLVDGERILIGESTRTNAAGINAVKAAVEGWGYRVHSLPVRGSLHLKTALTRVHAGLFVHDAAGIERSALVAALGREQRILDVSEEPAGANVVSLNGGQGAPAVAIASSAPRTAVRLAQEGVEVHPVDLSELEKAEAGPTCLSVLWDES